MGFLAEKHKTFLAVILVSYIALVLVSNLIAWVCDLSNKSNPDLTDEFPTNVTLEYKYLFTPKSSYIFLSVIFGAVVWRLTLSKRGKGRTKG